MRCSTAFDDAQIEERVRQGGKRIEDACQPADPEAAGFQPHGRRTTIDRWPCKQQANNRAKAIHEAPGKRSLARHAATFPTGRAEFFESETVRRKFGHRAEMSIVTWGGQEEVNETSMRIPCPSEAELSSDARRWSEGSACASMLVPYAFVLRNDGSLAKGEVARFPPLEVFRRRARAARQAGVWAGIRKPSQELTFDALLES